MMYCPKCNKNRKPEEFYPYRLSECKYCVGARTGNDYVRRRDNNNGSEQERRRTWHLKKKFGITPEDVQALLDIQDGHCALCPNTEPGGFGTWHVDHDHVTMAVRGLLCWPCNSRLGILEKNREWTQRAEAYLSSPPALLIFQK